MNSAQDDANLSSFTLSTLDEILDLEQLEMAPVTVTGESLPESPPVSPANEAAQAAAMLISSFNLGGSGAGSGSGGGPSLNLNGDSQLMIVNAQPTTTTTVASMTHSSASHSNDSNNNLLHHLQLNGLSGGAGGHSPLPPPEANIASDHDYYTAKPSAGPRTAAETLLVLSAPGSSRPQTVPEAAGDLTLEYLSNGVQAFELEVAHHVELVDETTAPLLPPAAPSLSPLRLSPVRKIQYIRPLAASHPRPVVGNQQPLQPQPPVRPFAYSPIRTTTHQKSVRGPKLPKPQASKMARPVPSVLPSSSTFALESRPARQPSAISAPSNLPPIKYKLHSNQNYRKRQQKRSQETSMLDSASSRSSLPPVSVVTTPKSPPPSSPSSSPPDFKVIRVISQPKQLQNGYGHQAPPRQASRTLTMRPNGSSSSSTSSAKSAISPLVATAMLSSFTPGIASAMASKEKDTPIKKPRYGAIERRAASAMNALGGESASPSATSKGRKSALSAGESQVNYLNKVKRPVGRPRKHLPAEPKPPKEKKTKKPSKEAAKQPKGKAEKRTKTPVIKEDEEKDEIEDPPAPPSPVKVPKPRVNEFKSVPMEEEEVASPALPMSEQEESSGGEAEKVQEDVEEDEGDEMKEKIEEDEALPKVASPSKAPLSFIPIASTSRGSCEAKRNPFELVECQQFEEDDEPPFHVKMKADTLAIMDLHAHCLKTEIIGLLGGHYCRVTKTVHIKTAEPCPSMVNDTISCEIDPVSQAIALEKLEAQNYQVVGWYHSHPTFSPEPSNRDIETQSYYQRMFNEISSAHSATNDGRPYVALILSPFTKPDLGQLKSNASFQVTLPQQTYEGKRFYSGEKKYAYADFATRQVRYLSAELNGLLASPYKCFWVANYASEDADLMIPYEMKLELLRDERLVPSIVGNFGPMCQWIARDYRESIVRLGKTFTRIGSISVNYLDKIIASLTHHLQAIAGEQECERIRQEVIAILVEEFQPAQEKE